MSQFSIDPLFNPTERNLLNHISYWSYPFSLFCCVIFGFPFNCFTPTWNKSFFFFTHELVGLHCTWLDQLKQLPSSSQPQLMLRAPFTRNLPPLIYLLCFHLNILTSTSHLMDMLSLNYLTSHTIKHSWPSRIKCSPRTRVKFLSSITIIIIIIRGVRQQTKS